MLDLMASVEGVVPIGSPRSVLNIIGIIWLVFCLVMGGSGIKGWLSCFCCFFVMMTFVALSRPDVTENLSASQDSLETAALAPYIYVNGQFINEREWLRQDHLAYDKRTIRTPYMNHHANAPKYYRMHAFNGLEWWVYHPDAWWWSPFFGCLLGMFRPMWRALSLTSSIFQK